MVSKKIILAPRTRARSAIPRATHRERERERESFMADATLCGASGADFLLSLFRKFRKLHRMYEKHCSSRHLVYSEKATTAVAAARRGR